MNLLGGLEAAANFGTGFNTGQQTAINQGYQNRMNAVATDTAETQNQQMHSALDKQAQLNDYAMKLFSPATSDPLNPGKPPAQGGAPQGPGGPDGGAGPTPPNGPGVAGQVTDQSSPVDKMNALANRAAGIGDLTTANQLWTNASNMTTDQFKRQQEQAATQKAQVEATIASHGFVASQMGAATDAAEFQQAKMAVLSSPIVPQNEKENIAKMQYSPQVVDMIRRTGVKSVDDSRLQLEQLRFDEEQRRNNFRDSLDEIRTSSQVARDKAYVEHEDRLAKVGGASKGPTREEIGAASSFVKDQMGPNVDTTSPNFQQAVQSIAARAKQIAGTNRAITYPQAVQQATDEAQKSGEFTQSEKPQATIGSVKIPFTGGQKSTTYTPKGQTAATALPMPPATPEGRKQMIPGHWYLLNGTPTQYNPGQ